MEIVDNYVNVITKKYMLFTGRSRRREFWMFVLANIVVAIVVGILNGILFRSVNVLPFIYSLAILLPGLGLGIRRMHDVGKSGFWLLINLIPLVGTIIYLVFCATPGDAGANAYGPDPKA